MKIRVAVAVALLAGSFLPASWAFAFSLAAYIAMGWDVLIAAWEGLRAKKPFDERVLMSVASLGAVAIGEYREAALVMLLYQIGEALQDAAADRSRDSIRSALDLRPDVARLADGRVVSPEEVPVGSVIMLRPGDRVPLDGIVTEGASALDTAALTGESVPRDVSQGDGILSGCVNLTGLLKVRTTANFSESTASKVLRLIEESAEKKSKQEDFIERFARVYTPAVVIAALLLFIVPSVAAGGWLVWGRRALNFLVVSCPCALVIAVPLSYFCGMGRASKEGILIKGSAYLEALNRAKTAVFDKTGTFTKGEFRVKAAHPASGSTREELLYAAALAQAHSTHPIALSLREGMDAPEEGVVSEAIPGMGVQSTFEGRTIHAGNEKLMEHIGASCEKAREAGTHVYVAEGGRCLGHIVLSDVLRDTARSAVVRLREQGVEHIVMLTGDREDAAKEIAEALGIAEYRANLLPADKVREVEKLLARPGALLFAGDGINDAPVIKRADVGFAMGALGSDAAIEAADAVVMDDDPEKIARAVEIAKKTARIARQNIALALGIKAAVLALSVATEIPMTLAVFADVGVALLATGNAMRAGR